MRANILALMVAVALGGAIYTADAEQTLPLRPEPVGRAEQLNEPYRTIRIAQAEALRDAQEAELEALDSSGDRWRELFIAGLTFALEEYYQMELSYPDCSAQLHESGYLLEGWSDAGFLVTDFNMESSGAGERTLIYVPQPVGLVGLICDPILGCATKIRWYTEYSLLVPERHFSLWSEEGYLRTYWVKPFLEFGVEEVCHIDHNDPGKSGCVAIS